MGRILIQSITKVTLFYMLL
ncbi:hypothetical protein B4U80_09189 [Leptotrombidium deliense]|uniref:Uncharacterized protein n=1 Tax=Leptotrombidium deliense TaxID=299467 RepID=A0A443RWL2_9ACAR|nr:hypothetical protein B4U80_09189 [Leptotrombidium deliense]